MGLVYLQTAGCRLLRPGTKVMVRSGEAGYIGIGCPLSGACHYTTYKRFDDITHYIQKRIFLAKYTVSYMKHNHTTPRKCYYTVLWSSSEEFAPTNFELE